MTASTRPWATCRYCGTLRAISAFDYGREAPCAHCLPRPEYVEPPSPAPRKQKVSPLTPGQIAAIQADHASGIWNQRELAARHGIAESTVRRHTR